MADRDSDGKLIERFVVIEKRVLSVAGGPPTDLEDERTCCIAAVQFGAEATDLSVHIAPPFLHMRPTEPLGEHGEIISRDWPE